MLNVSSTYLILSFHDTFSRHYLKIQFNSSQPDMIVRGFFSNGNDDKLSM